jgi:tetratricopeptide (TPR) repeat protein
MSLEKLKDTARKFEQKEDWRKAIEAYVKAIQQMESGREAAPDLSLYNRVGDLYLKINDTQAAVRHYERAVDLYADQGFFNNAIALCGKILRVNPGRTQTYLKLAQLHARKNVVIEAKRNLLEFIERMNAQGQLDDAFAAVKDFADQFSGSQEIRLMLVELLRASQRREEAHEQLDKLCNELEASGDVVAARRTRERLEDAGNERDGGRPRGGGLIFLDTGFGTSAPAAAPAAADPVPLPDPEPLPSLVASPPDPEVEVAASSAEGLLPPESLVIEPSSAEAGQLGGFETTTVELLDDAETAALIEGIQLDSGVESVDPVPLNVGLERIDAEVINPVQLGGLEPGDVSFERVADAPIEVDLGAGPSDAEPGPELDLSAELQTSLDDAVGPASPEQPSGADLDTLEAPGPDSAAAEPADLLFIQTDAALSELEQAVADRPDDPAAHRTLAEQLLRAGDADRAREELEIAARWYEAGEEWERASEVIALIVTLAPYDIRHHQKLVEFAYRSGSKPRLIEAYLALADALLELGESDKAEAVYRRVVDHEPENGRALEGLARLGEGTALAAAAERADSPVPVPKPPTRPAPRSAGDFVDLGALIMDDTGPRRDTRMRVEGLPPSDDEQRNFEETLAAFKRGIEENVELDDYHTHYDLGVAFKEMGLLDEAIAEFQKALRAPEGRLRTAEALGTAFFDKGQFAVAENLLRRAVETLAGGDDEKIGLLYWLGRTREAQGKQAEAMAAYERALAVDIRFMDTGERVQRLGVGRQ